MFLKIKFLFIFGNYNYIIPSLPLSLPTHPMHLYVYNTRLAPRAWGSLKRGKKRL